MRAMTPATAELARAVCERLGPRYAAAPAAARCLSDSPDGRRVTELRFRPRDQPGDDVRIIAKQFAGDTGAATYAAMKALEGAAARGASPLAVPRALFYAPEVRALGLEPAPGRSYRELAREERFTDHLRLAGGALAALHALDVPALRIATLEDHIADLMRPGPEALAAAMPRHAESVAAVVAGLRAGERRLLGRARVAPVPLHRDFHLGQLFRSGGRVALIDWDLVALGDPALDLGNFAAYLRIRVPHAAARGWRAFAAGYAERAGTAALGRVALYEALTYLRLACKRLRLKPDGYERDIARLLRLARERLA
jgi:aminoglycoside phosphotransferase (APT) family kinase protein